MSEIQITETRDEEAHFKAAIRDYIEEIDQVLHQIHQDHEAIERSRERTEAILADLKAMGYA